MLTSAVSWKFPSGKPLSRCDEQCDGGQAEERVGGTEGQEVSGVFPQGRQVSGVGEDTHGASEDGVILVAEEDHVQTVCDRDQAKRQGLELRWIELQSRWRNEDANQPDHLDDHVAHLGGGDPVSVPLVDIEILM